MEDTTAIARLRHVARHGVEVLAAELPYVTLLPRVRGNSGVERGAQEPGSTKKVMGVRDDIEPHLVSRLLFGTVNCLVEW